MSSFASRFLERPDLFPGRIAGEVSGDDEVTIALAPGSYRLIGLNPRQRASVVERFPSRVQAATDKDFQIRVFDMADREFAHFDMAGWVYSMDFDHRPNRVCMAGVGFLGIVELAQESGSASGFVAVSAALWSSEREGFSAAVLENFLRVVVSYRLLAAGGVMLHSAAVVNATGAHVFVGHSGAGKSTISQLSADAGHRVLSDDINALIPTDGLGSFIVDQVPFAGDFGREQLCEGRYPLVGLYRLEQHAEHALEPLSSSDALAMLVANAPFVNSDENRMDALFGVLSGLASGMQAHRLLFRRDAGFWNLLS